MQWKSAIMCLLPPRLALGAEESVFLVPHRPTLFARVSDHCDSGQNKHIHFQKENKSLFLPTISVLPLCSQSLEPFQPLAKQIIPGVSEWVMVLYSTPLRSEMVCFLDLVSRPRLRSGHLRCVRRCCINSVPHPPSSG